MANVTDRQKELLDIVAESMTRLHRPPTFREIMARMNVRSLNSVQGHVNALVRKGLLRRQGGRGKSCNLMLTGHVVVPLTTDQAYRVLSILSHRATTTGDEEAKADYRCFERAIVNSGSANGRDAR